MEGFNVFGTRIGTMNRLEKLRRSAMFARQFMERVEDGNGGDDAADCD